jgi:hypothetical protein
MKKPDSCRLSKRIAAFEAQEGVFLAKTGLPNLITEETSGSGPRFKAANGREATPNRWTVVQRKHFVIY